MGVLCFDTRSESIHPFSYNSKQNILFNKNDVHLFGLNKVDATSYMNATLQCLSNINELTNYLLSENVYHQIKIDKFRGLSNAYIELLDNLCRSNKINYSLKNFKNILRKMNFNEKEKNNPKDLVIFLLETLHTELNKVKSENIKNNSSGYDFELCFKNYSDFFKANFRSIISDLFYGTQNSMIQCNNCSRVFNSIKYFNILDFTLEYVRKFKNYPQNIVSIMDCFEYNEQFENSTGQNQIFCNNCKEKYNVINSNKIILSSKILIINLNRGKEFNTKLYFEENLDITNYVFRNESPKKYELIGVVTLYGDSVNSGHFVAYFKCKPGKYIEWYKYDDTEVTISNFNEILNNGTPILLFYHYIE